LSPQRIAGITATDQPPPVETCHGNLAMQLIAADTLPSIVEPPARSSFP